MNLKMKRRGIELKLPYIPRTWWTRALAFVLALLLLAGLGWWVNLRVGNPVSAWYTEKKIAAHYNAYHSGEGYLVGPAKYQWVQRADGTVGMDYVCSVYKKGSVDTGFTAYFDDGAVFSSENVTTYSGSNTYNRFRNRLNEELAASGVAGHLRKDRVLLDIFAGFHTEREGALFDPDAPVFKLDAEFDRESLPLATVVCTDFSVDETTEISRDEILAEYLMELKAACEKEGQPFDYYSVQLTAGTALLRLALDVPSEQVTPEALPEYLAALSEEEKTMVGWGFMDKTVASRKNAWLFSHGYEHCAH